MTQGFAKTIYLSPSESELLIEAHVPIEGQAQSYRRLLFRASQVDGVYEIDSARAGLLLSSGVAIPTTLSFEKLKRAVFMPDFKTGRMLDLTLVTGKAVGEVEKIRLSKEFNPNADANTAKPIHANVEIRALLRRAESTDCVIHVFRQADIAKMSPSETTRSRSGSSVKIAFKTSSYHTPNPYGSSDCMLDMPLDDFVAAIAEAAKTPEGKLDLVETFTANKIRYGLKS
jgi:hypothetical protein